MLSPIQRALADIHANIPDIILEAAFNPTADYRVSLDTAIINQVILARVRDAVSVRGGRVMDIVLQQRWAHHTVSPTPFAVGVTGTFSSFVIPPEARENRDINAILGIHLLTAMGTGSQNAMYNNLTLGGVTLAGLGHQALQAQTARNVIALPTPELKDGNVVVLNPPQNNFAPWTVTIRLSYDDNFSNMPGALLEPFSKVVLAAVKNYIYTKLYLRIEANMVLRGAEIGAIKQMVDSYSDANREYEEALLAMGGAEIFDPARTMRILRRIVSHV